MKKITIDRRIWLRGEGSNVSKLLRNRDNKMCCIGIALNQLGVSTETLREQETTIGLRLDNIPLPAPFDECRASYISNILENSISYAYEVNDSLTLSQEDREREIIAVFKDIDLEVEFTN